MARALVQVVLIQCGPEFMADGQLWSEWNMTPFGLPRDSAAMRRALQAKLASAINENAQATTRQAYRSLRLGTASACQLGCRSHRQTKLIDRRNFEIALSFVATPARSPWLPPSPCPLLLQAPVQPNDEGLPAPALGPPRLRVLTEQHLAPFR